MHLLLIFLICLIEIITNIYIKNNNENKKIKIIFMGLCIFLFAALRSYNVGIDVPAYFKQYYEISTLDINGVIGLNHRDPAFPLFLKYLHQ